MVEHKDSLIRHYQKMREDFLTAINGLSDELMIETSINGWSVKDYLAHIAFWDDLKATEVVRI